MPKYSNKMIDFSHLNKISTLAPLMAAGGILAAVITGWNHIKNWFGSFKRLLIVQANLDERIGNAVHLYLLAHYKRSPSGRFVYVGIRRQFNAQENYYVIPFNIEYNECTVYRGWRFMFIVRGGNRCVHQISAFRGIVDIEAFMKQAVHWYNTEFASSRVIQRNRYHVEDVIGSEKNSGGLAALSLHSNRSGNDGGIQPATAELKSGLEDADISDALEKSFLYDKADYVQNNQDDPLAGLYFPKRILEQFEQAKQWLDMGQWYVERSIPWRRGWLFYGPGGTGKSSLAKAIAQVLGIPIYRYFLNTLSDQEFIREWSHMQNPCVALLEDFDNAFHGRVAQTEHKSLSFDTVLNMISGINSTNGVLLIVTTNRLELVDPAIGTLAEDGHSTRPGRIDQIVEIGLMGAEERDRMAEHILRDWPDEIEKLRRKIYTPAPTPTQFMEECVGIAFSRLKAPRNNVTSLEKWMKFGDQTKVL